MGEKRDVELKVGRRSADGIVRLSAYPPQLVQLSVGYRGQQSASVLLTQEQIRALRDALGAYVDEASVDEASVDKASIDEAPVERESNQTWDHTERRSEESHL
jgi:hypothetical protein